MILKIMQKGGEGGLPLKRPSKKLQVTPRTEIPTAPTEFVSLERFTATRSSSSVLIAVVGVDVEAEDGVDFDGLRATHGGTKLPAGQGGHDLRGHGGGAGFEDLQIFQVAGSVEFAFDHDAGVGKIGGQIGAKALRTDECAGACVRGRVGFGELHDDGADRGIDVDGVVVAGELAVEIEGSAGSRRGDDSDGRALLFFHVGAVGKFGIVGAAAIRSEAGQSDDGAAAADVDARDGGRSGGSGASAAGTGSGRDSGAGVGVGAMSCAGFSRARAFAG